ncbi:lycopene cyclase family protein [Corynebacterium jeikeium]|uniref:lycopene cyclase family protein n=1 Tax=Corynebacterium jeikeium TaxID=38289 RepID=UPI0001B71A07|nr:lycopene cyclase family protein [Corynebacterium jeikeium]EEW16317.1 lycopene cyclase family protein [Corynebacterium jeikeium ATCC 43734]WCZ53531.1 Lycopene cyclase protein [Corynebacterium jeikeium]SUY81158.1 lycopene beta cyclase [Corynebacterium jeikeium]
MTQQLVLKGLGPAGALLAIRAAQRGFHVTAYDPAFDVHSSNPFPGTYGVFSTQIPAWADHLFAAPEPLQVVAGTPLTRRSLGFSYRMLDQRAVAEALRCSNLRIEASPLPEGENAVDCTGAPRTDTALWQLAVGWFLPLTDAPSESTPTFMDWTGTVTQAGDCLPSFCYVQRTDEGWLYEETILAAHCSADAVKQEEVFEVLRVRLADRIGRLGAENVLREELVAIPMGTRRRHKESKFGAAAGFINPATGYSLGHALESADDFLDGQRTGGWLAYLLRQVGGELIARADGAVLQDFFGHFFDLDTQAQLAYLSGRDGLAVARTMWVLRKGTGLRHEFLRPLFRQPWSVGRAVWRRLYSA